MQVLHQMHSPSIRFGRRRFRNRPEFTGDYSSWSAASGAAEGFDLPQIVGKVRSGALKVKDGTAAFERNGLLLLSGISVAAAWQPAPRRHKERGEPARR